MAVQDTVNYYNSKKTNAYGLMLDASKAFDRVFKEELSPLMMWLLIHMYTNQQLQVKCGNVISHRFEAINGVKQGGVLSPILFSHLHG